MVNEVHYISDIDLKILGNSFKWLLANIMYLIRNSSKWSGTVGLVQTKIGILQDI